MTTRQRNIGINSIAAFFILLFSYTAFSKLFSIHQFQFSLKMSPLLRYQASLISWTVTIAELLVAGCLLIPKWRTLGLILSSILMLTFTMYIAYMVFALSKRNLPCSCGGVVSWLSWKSHLTFNTVSTAAAMIGSYWSATRRKEEPYPIVYT